MYEIFSGLELSLLADIIELFDLLNLMLLM